jgi:hypothetical protein
MMMKPMGMSSTAAGGDKKGGGGNETPVQIKGNANNDGRVKKVSDLQQQTQNGMRGGDALGGGN